MRYEIDGRWQCCPLHRQSASPLHMLSTPYSFVSNDHLDIKRTMICANYLTTFVVCMGGGFLLVAEAFVLPLPSHPTSTSTTAVAAVVNNGTDQTCTSTDRRSFFGTVGIVSVALVPPFSMFTAQPAYARYILDEDTGDYVEIEDVAWQTEWKQRLDKASTMTKDEIFEAARGAGNTNLKTGPESPASQKRRALSACRDSTVRAKAGLANERECTARVLAGEIDFLLEAL